MTTLLGLDTAELELSTDQERVLEIIDLESWLVMQPSPVARELTGRPSSPYSHEDVNKLELRVMSLFSSLEPPNSKPSILDAKNVDLLGPKCAVLIVQLLAKIVAAKTQDSSERSLPATGWAFTPKYPSNPFGQDLVTSLQRVRLWRKQFGRVLGTIGPKEAPGRAVILLSAILYGGIFDTDLLIAVARALLMVPESLGLASQRAYLQISVAWRGRPDCTNRTWYPDPLTATLIARMANSQWPDSKRASRRKFTDQLWAEMVAAFRIAGVMRATEPVSLSSLLTDLRTASQLQMPPILAAYAAHEVRASGLPARTMKRLYPVRPAKDVEPTRAGDRTLPGDDSELEALTDDPEEKPRWHRLLRNIFKEEKTGKARQRLQQLLTTVLPAQLSFSRLMFEFADDLLSPEGGGMKIATARVWVLTVIRHLGDLLRDQELSALTTEDLEDFYREALEEMDPDEETPAIRKRLARSLRAFHAYLVRRLDIRPLADSSMFSAFRTDSPVDANLITVEEYHQILRWLDRNWPSTVDPRLQPVARILVILGFRCGLRRTEALWINLDDVFEFGTMAELLIRPSKGHPLKSSSATRRLPISLLMSKHECAQFLIARRQRASQGAAADSPLFAIAGRDGHRLSQRRLLPIIHEAMRVVTGDESLRFHHLRHSWATWGLIRLMVGESRKIPEQLTHLSETRAWLEDARAFCDEIYDVPPSKDLSPSDQVAQNTTRMHAYLLAQMIGHSHPAVTLKHYVHGMDWLLDACLRGAPDLKPSVRTVALASGIPLRTAFKWAQHDTADLPVRMIKKRWPELAEAVSAAPEIRTGNELWPWRAWDLLYRHLTRGEELSSIAGDYGFSSGQASGILNRANHLCKMSARHGGRGPQHGMVKRAITAGIGREVRIACPNYPALPTDKAVVDRLALSLSLLLDGKSDFAPVLSYYVDNIWQAHNQLYFRDPDEPEMAIAYMALLKALLEKIGIKQPRFFALHQSHHSEALDKWRTTFELEQSHPIHRVRPPTKKGNSYKRWIGIEPLMSSSKPARGNNSTGSYGFRFLMLMAYVVYGG